MIQSKLPLSSLSERSSVRARRSKINQVLLFFILSIIAQQNMQFKIASHIPQHQDVDSLIVPDVTKFINTGGSDAIPKLQPQKKGHQILLNEHNAPISQLNASEGNRTFEYGDSITVEKRKRASHSRQRQQIGDSNGKDPLNSHDSTKVNTRIDEKIINRMKTLNKRETNDKRKTRIIFGIMTYDSNEERRRRDLIRSTFLSYFTNYTNRTLVTEEEYNEKKHWICSLNDLDHGRLEYPEKCRMAYAFVQGANPNGTSMLLNFNESYPLSLPPPKKETESGKGDIFDSIYLNIQENGKFGKSPTWFRYAIDVLERHGWMKDWDYIYKSDTDNLIFTPNFFRFMDKLPRKTPRVYGGLPLDYKKCGGDAHDDCKLMTGRYFMQGGCYFLSRDLANYISDETTFDHQAVKLPHEDMTTGNFVYSHPKNIKVIRDPKGGVDMIRFHPVKKDKKFKHKWEKMLWYEQDRLSSTALPA
jgi:hypothetical protein